MDCVRSGGVASGGLGGGGIAGGCGESGSDGDGLDGDEACWAAGWGWKMPELGLVDGEGL